MQENTFFLKINPDGREGQGNDGELTDITPLRNVGQKPISEHLHKLSDYVDEQHNANKVLKYLQSECDPTQLEKCIAYLIYSTMASERSDYNVLLAEKAMKLKRHTLLAPKWGCSSVKLPCGLYGSLKYRTAWEK